MTNLRILIADDHDLLRRGVKALLESHSGWTVCAEARTGLEAVAHAEELRPDIAILDIAMPDLNGIEAARRLQDACPRTEILLLSVHHSDQLIREIIESGIRGFVVKSDSDQDLLKAVEALSTHKPWMTGVAAELLLSGKGGLDKKLERLTSRERETVQLLAEGKTSKEIASALGISVTTAETHRANLMRKLEVHSVGELVRYAVRNQIIEP
ncbi:MAG TPA: response regulator transcription factor [Candidatus Acidoferrales bacterium]|nr:response regulator transcription factor [Candidatus Acidoferrales bacterium]